LKSGFCIVFWLLSVGISYHFFVFDLIWFGRADDDACAIRLVRERTVLEHDHILVKASTLRRSLSQAKFWVIVLPDPLMLLAFVGFLSTPSHALAAISLYTS